jgi:syntenin-1
LIHFYKRAEDSNMSVYPSLEDMKVDHLMQAQEHAASNAMPSPHSATYPSAPSAFASAGPHTGSYPGLAEYMGLELTEAEVRANMPEYLPAVVQSSSIATVPRSGLVAPISGLTTGLAKAQVTHGVRQVVLCKDADGKIGLRVKAVNKGVFVCLVTKGSPAALGGLRFGDQILQVDGVNLAGFSSDKVHDLLKKAAVNNITMAVRDRPFERTLTLHKDSTGHIGFQFKDGKITSIVVDSSAARNGLLIDHQLLEVNGQNVVGVKDKEVGVVIEEGGDVITITIIPTYIYNIITKNMSTSLVKKLMDHSIPEM